MADAPAPRPGLGDVGRQLRELYARQSRGRRLAAAGVLAAVALAVAVPRLLRHDTAWATVGEPASAAAADELLATLQGRGLAPRLVGRRVEVPADQLSVARAPRPRRPACLGAAQATSCSTSPASVSRVSSSR
jgi:hypothetical protein